MSKGATQTLLFDLDELAQKVIASVSRECISEAVAAYRAAIGVIWVAICTDLIEKIRELAALGDAEARAESEYFETILA